VLLFEPIQAAWPGLHFGIRRKHSVRSRRAVRHPRDEVEIVRGERGRQTTSIRKQNIILMSACCICIYASVSMHRLDLGHFNEWCCRWGCLPPTSSLLGMHLFWFSLLWPLPIVVNRIWPAWTKRVGIGLLAFGSVFVLAVCIWATVQWWPVANTEWLRLLPYSVVRQTDLPAIQLCLVGGAMLV
jgi:hypothetical protein